MVSPDGIEPSSPPCHGGVLPFYHGDFFLYNGHDDRLEPVVLQESRGLDRQIYTSSPDAWVGRLPLDHPASSDVGAVGPVVDHLGHYHLACPGVFELHPGAAGEVPVGDPDVVRSELSVEADCFASLQFVILPSEDRCVARSRGRGRAHEESDQSCQ